MKNHKPFSRLPFKRLEAAHALIGRYFLFHLYPFSLSEIGCRTFENLTLWHRLHESEDWSDLLDRIAVVDPLGYDLWGQMYEFGPFPEPLLKADKAFSNRYPFCGGT